MKSVFKIASMSVFASFLAGTAVAATQTEVFSCKASGLDVSGRVQTVEAVIWSELGGIRNLNPENPFVGGNKLSAHLGYREASRDLPIGQVFGPAPKDYAAILGLREIPQEIKNRVNDRYSLWQYTFASSGFPYYLEFLDVLDENLNPVIRLAGGAFRGWGVCEKAR